jgi:hypothetical protein
MSSPYKASMAPGIWGICTRICSCTCPTSCGSPFGLRFTKCSLRPSHSTLRHAQCIAWLRASLASESLFLATKLILLAALNLNPAVGVEARSYDSEMIRVDYAFFITRFVYESTQYHTQGNEETQTNRPYRWVIMTKKLKIIALNKF